MKQKIKLLLAMAVFAMLCSFSTVRADAAIYRSADVSLPYNIKVGNYHVWIDEQSDYSKTLYVKDTRTGSVTMLTKQSGRSCITNGNDIFYSVNCESPVYDGNYTTRIYKYSLATKKKTKIATMLNVRGVYGCYGNNLYIERKNTSDQKCYLYLYSLKTKKLSKVQQTNIIVGGYGRYILTMPGSGVNYQWSATVYDAKTKRTKTITDKSWMAQIYENGRTFYYVNWEKDTPDTSGNYRFRVYKYDLLMGKRSALTKIFAAKYIDDITNHVVEYRTADNNNKYYKITF